MLNGLGGRVVFGVTPNGEIRGQQVSDRALEQLATELQRIDPNVVPEVTTVPMAVHEVEQMLLERMHGTDRWENPPAPGWTVEDLDSEEIVRTVRESARRGRLVVH